MVSPKWCPKWVICQRAQVGEAGGELMHTNITLLRQGSQVVPIWLHGGNQLVDGTGRHIVKLAVFAIGTGPVDGQFGTCGMQAHGYALAIDNGALGLLTKLNTHRDGV